MQGTRFSSLLILFFLLSTSQSLLFSETQKATLTYFKGTISIYRNKTLVSPKINMNILPGDSLITADESNLEITYENGSVSSIEPNSVLKIGELKKEKGLFTTKIKTWLGSVLCKVKKLSKGEKFIVYTPTAVASVRGTVFETVVEETQETSFNVLSGQLLAKALIEDAKTYLLDEKFKYFVGKEGIPDVRKLTEKELSDLKKRATAYIRGFMEEKKEEIKKDIEKKVKKGCLGFI